MHPRPPLIALLCAAALGVAACGGGSSDDDNDRADTPAPLQGERTTPMPRAPAPGPESDPLGLPPGVPTRGTGPADPAATRVIRRWANTLRAGDVRGAARLWDTPAKAQNGTDVLLLQDRRSVLEFNVGLTCGAQVTGTRSAGRYTIVTFRLTNRKGPGAVDCGSAGSARARTAVRVEDGRITEWYRIPDRAGGDPALQGAPVI